MNCHKILRIIAVIFAIFAAFTQASFAAGQAKKHILFMMTSHGELNGTGKKTGVWFDALATPYYMLKDAGYEVTLASINGLKVPIDSRSEEQPTAATKRFLADKIAMQQLNDSASLTEVKADDYDAVFLPGGHGVMWDNLDNVPLRGLLSSFVQHNKIIAAVDHGAVAFLGVTGADGKPFIVGRKMTVFTREEERALGLIYVVPVYADFSLELSGAVINRAAPFKANVVQDGTLITGQNPASVEKVARLMVKALK